MKQNPEKWGNCIKNHNCIKNGNHTLICKSLIYEKKNIKAKKWIQHLRKRSIKSKAVSSSQLYVHDIIEVTLKR